MEITITYTDADIRRLIREDAAKRYLKQTGANEPVCGIVFTIVQGQRGGDIVTTKVDIRPTEEDS